MLTFPKTCIANRRCIDWWNDDTSKAFARKAFDMVNQYNHFNVDQVNMETMSTMHGYTREV